MVVDQASAVQDSGDRTIMAGEDQDLGAECIMEVEDQGSEAGQGLEVGQGSGAVLIMGAVGLEVTEEDMEADMEDTIRTVIRVVPIGYVHISPS